MARSRSGNPDPPVGEAIVDVDVIDRDAGLVPGVRLLRHLLTRPAGCPRRAEARAAPDPLPDGPDGSVERPRSRQDAPVWSARSWAACTRTAIRRSTTHWSAWPSRSRCGCPSSTATATSAPPTTARRPCATPSAGWPPPRPCIDAIDEDVVDFGPELRRPRDGAGGAAGSDPRSARQRHHRHRRRHGHQHGPAQPVEVVAAARHLLKHPKATLETLMRYVPGPDLPTGGQIIGLDGIREAYETGRGRSRSGRRHRWSQVTPRKRGIVITELPYNVGPNASSRRSRNSRSPRRSVASPR
jgi:hypothetical protein